MAFHFLDISTRKSSQEERIHGSVRKEGGNLDIRKYRLQKEGGNFRTEERQPFEPSGVTAGHRRAQRPQVTSPTEKTCVTSYRPLICRAL